MAQDSDASRAADKGKGKALDEKKPEELKKDKDGNVVNGRREDENADCMFGFALVTGHPVR